MGFAAMTDRHYRLLGHIFEGVGLAISIIFAWAELTGHRSPLPSLAMLGAIFSLMIAWVLLGVYGKSSH